MAGPLLLLGLVGASLLAASAPLPAASGSHLTIPGAAHSVMRGHGPSRRGLAEGSSAEADSSPDPCHGRRIYTHKLPAKFNEKLQYSEEEASSIAQEWYTAYMLSHLQSASTNGGFGKPIPSVVGPAVRGVEDAWYETDQNSLELIFFNRMRTYRCRVDDYREADLVYVPYFGGFDALRFMHKEPRLRDTLALELVALLQFHPAWQRSNGSDHFLVLGRNIWDFYRSNRTSWGSKLLEMDGVRHNMWAIVVESVFYEPRIISAPKPTAFHPVELWQLQRWQEFVRGQERKWLFSFAGGSRSPDTEAGVMREKLFWQCRNSPACSTVSCTFTSERTQCDDVASFFQLYLSSSFCLHPTGDACSRRSVLDGMLAGCIPVVFMPCTLQEQFPWHFPPAKSRFFVYIPAESLRGPLHANDSASLPLGASGSSLVLIEEELRKISPQEVLEMRRAVVEHIQALAYAGAPQEGGFAWPNFRDSIDVIIDGLVEHAVPQERRALAK